MELQIPIIFAISILTLNLAKISHLILSIQAIVVAIVSIIFMHTNLTYLAYALIYVYIGAICVLFLYFMMLLQNRWEVHGMNSWFIFTVITGIEIISYSLGYIITYRKNYNQEIGIILNEKSYELKYVVEALELEGLRITLVIMLLVIGVIIPIFLTNLSLKFEINYKNPLGEITQSRINLIANSLIKQKKVLRTDWVTLKIGILLAFGKDAYGKIIGDPSVNPVELDIFKSIAIYLAEYSGWDVDTVKFYMVLLLQLLCLAFINVISFIFIRKRWDSNLRYDFLFLNKISQVVGERLLLCLAWLVIAILHILHNCYITYINNNKRSQIRPSTISSFKHKIMFFIGYVLFLLVIYLFYLAGMSIEDADIFSPEDKGIPPKSISMSTPAPAVAMEVKNVALKEPGLSPEDEYILDPLENFIGYLNPINWFHSVKSRMQPTLIWWKNSGRDAIASRDMGRPYSIPKGLPREEQELSERFLYGPRLNARTNFLPAEFNNYHIPSPAEIAFGQRMWNNIYNQGMSIYGLLGTNIMELFDSSNRISLQGIDLVCNQFSINLWDREIFDGVKRLSATIQNHIILPQYFRIMYRILAGLEMSQAAYDYRIARWLHDVYQHLFVRTNFDQKLANSILTDMHHHDIPIILRQADIQHAAMEGFRRSLPNYVRTWGIPHPRLILIRAVLDHYFRVPANWPMPNDAETSFRMVMIMCRKSYPIMTMIRSIIERNYTKCVPDIYTALRHPGISFNRNRYIIYMPCFRVG